MHIIIISIAAGTAAGAAAIWLFAGTRQRRQTAQILRFIHNCRHLHPANTLERLKKHLESKHRF